MNDDYEGWRRCTRKCLQDCDADNFEDRKECDADPCVDLSVHSQRSYLAALRPFFKRLVQQRCLRSAAALGLVLPLLLSCAYATGKPRTVEGKDFPYAKVEQIHKGMPAEEVRQLLGEPLEVDDTPTGKLWRYYERERQDERIYVLGLIPVNRPYWVVDTELVLEIEAGIVKTVSFHENRVK